MLATFIYHSQSLSDPIGVAVDPVQREQLEDWERPFPSPPTPWHRYHPSRKIDTNENSDNELEREMDFLGIPDVHQDQFTSPGSVSAEIRGFNPVDDYCENEARRGGKLGSALGIDLSGDADVKDQEVSGITTAIDPIFGNEHGSGISQSQGGRIPDEASLRRRRPERDVMGDLEKAILTANSSRSTIVPVSTTSDKNYHSSSIEQRIPDISMVERGDAKPEHGDDETPSSPDLTESSLVDITSYAPSAFSVSSPSNQGREQAHLSALPSSSSTRAHSPAFSISSYDVLSLPAEVASMPTSPHAMNASISLETYPPFDVHNIHHARHASRPVSHTTSSRASESGWTDGDLESDDEW